MPECTPMTLSDLQALLAAARGPVQRQLDRQVAALFHPASWSYKRRWVEGSHWPTLEEIQERCAEESA